MEQFLAGYVQSGLLMEEKSIHIRYRSTQSVKDFDSDTQRLITETIKFAGQAYAPYSNFRVSACLILENGTVLKGANVENASYPVGICAERTLLAHAVSNYPDQVIQTMALYVDKDLKVPVPPCGLCRQTMVEVENRQKKNIRVLLIAQNRTILQFDSCADLLPLSFGADFL